MKFYTKKLKQLLVELYGKDPDDKYLELVKRFEDHRGNEPQIDDVLLIGIKI